MKVSVNGEEREVPAGATVSELLANLGLEALTPVAVAVDRRVIPRTAHPTTALEEGAKVEVIRAVGGG